MTYDVFSKRTDPVFTKFEVQPAAGCIGAYISGIDLSEPLDEVTVAELTDAWVHYHVLFFRGQSLTPDQHVAFARYFGEPQGGGSIPRLEENPHVKKQEYTQESQRSGDVNMHADDTFTEIPSRGSVLYGVKMPAVGGDTIWVNTEAAYMALSPAFKELLADKTAVHDLSANFGYVAPGMDDPKIKIRIREHYPPVEHPVIRTHPVSGRKSIFVNEMVTTRIVGLELDESKAVLDFLFAHLRKHEFQCRLHWEDGTVAFWDNRASQHFVIPDFQPAYRLNHRVAIADTERPV